MTWRCFSVGREAESGPRTIAWVRVTVSTMLLRRLVDDTSWSARLPNECQRIFCLSAMALHWIFLYGARLSTISVTGWLTRRAPAPVGNLPGTGASAESFSHHLRILVTVRRRCASTLTDH
jgi:hypothetical protein